MKADKETVLYVVVLAFLAFYLYTVYFGVSTNSVMEKMVEEPMKKESSGNEMSPSVNLAGDKVNANDFTDNDVIPPEDGSFPAALLHDRRAQAPLQAQDLLPADPNDAWSTVNPEGRGSIAYKNFLEATHHFGIDTVGSSLKNANTSLRSDPPIPRITVSPWMQSTITPDTNRRELEIGTTT